MNDTSPNKFALDRILSKDATEKDKEMMLQVVQYNPITLVAVITSKNVSSKIKVKMISYYSLFHLTLSEDTIKIIFSAKETEAETLNALVMLLPNCFSGTLINYLAANKQLSNTAESYLRNYILTH